ncbi:efflux RND transporter periplasmic adaptor subunit [Rhodohalobacter barkolensis]|uniref:Efflux transporter periplasmic adaptor subunit n=1 Tax=Rhodohalobacter barkolensis TaxID=2053187 RepID=A0A2N0VG32_9BACT|nr:efflux RND transporter periplasmic adaptor subunit [Rhodohalobacter barkolensis]PKD43147.1 efflux transporter periplasmic adaptor subunit [Rhodohalobacter barkolensis]
MSKVTKRIVFFTVLAIVLGALAYPKLKPFFQSNDAQAQGGPGGGGGPLQVEAVVMEPETIQDRIFSSGTIRANEVVDLSTETSGIITGIFFDEGGEVGKGQLLLKINDSELQAQKQRANFRLNLAEQREERQRRLLERGGISQDDYDATLNEVNVLRSELNLIDAQIEKTEIKAPFAGRIGLKYVSEGSYISPNTRIASLQEIDPVKIDFSVPERYISRVDIGDEINFDVQGIDSSFVGDVYAIEPRIDSQTRTLQIRALSQNDEQILFPGAFANIVLILDEIDDALMLPTISVVPELNTQKIFVIRNGVIEQERIQTGIRTSDKLQIIEGVAVGDTVLTTGLLQVNPGTEVDIVKLNKSSEL